MKVTLDSQELMKAIVVYMALKGFGVDTDNFNFQWDNRVRSGNSSVEIEIKPRYYSTEVIKKFANG